MSGYGVPPCLPGVADLPGDGWRDLLAAISGYGRELVAAQPSVVAGATNLDNFEYDLEQRLIGTLRAHLGEVGVLAEEHFHRTGAPSGVLGRLRLVVDPVDGSRCYAKGSPTYAITVAGFLDDVPLFGVVHQPAGGHTYTAARGRGSYLGADPLLPVGTAPRQVAVRRGGPGVVIEALRVTRRLARAGYLVEDVECTSLKLCWISSRQRAGLIKPVAERNGLLSTWGLAAGQLIAEETGFPTRMLDGSPWRWRPGTIVVGDARFVEEVDAARSADGS